MDDENTEKIDATPASGTGKTAEPSQDPVKVELDKEKNRITRTEKEKAEFSLKKNAERLKELGGDPLDVLDIPIDTEEEIPEWYKKEKSKEIKKTALQLADGITDENTRELVKTYLEKRIVPSDNPEDDFRLAFGAVNSLKNKQVIEEVARRTTPKVTAAGGSQPGKVEEEFVPTPEEARLMQKPYNLSKEKILAARKRMEEKQA